MSINNLFEGGYAKKAYLPIGKQFVCGKDRVIYKKNTNNDSSKVYMRHNAKYIQVVNFEKEMIAKGKWKLPTPVKQSNNKANVKPCKEDQYRNPTTGRCVKIKPDKPAKPVKPAKPAKPAKPDKPVNNIKSYNISLVGKHVVLADDITDSNYSNLKDLIQAKGGKAHTLNTLDDAIGDTIWKLMHIFVATDIKTNTAKLKKAKQFNLTIIKYDKFMKLYTTLSSKYVLRDWIDINKLDWEYVAFNPNAIDFLEENYNNIEWFELAENPNAIDLLEKNPTKINWYRLSLNPNAIELLEKNPNKIDWDHLSGNPNAIHLLKKRLKLEKLYGDGFANTNRINWYSLSSNPNAIDLLKAQIKYEESLQHKLRGWDLNIKWEYLCLNPKAIKLLENNPNKINWDNLCLNPNAIELLEKNPNKINWNNLAANPNAIKLMEKKPHMINWDNLSSNPNAIKLLEKNKNMINWKNLSANKNAIDLIKERIEYERTLTQKQYNDLQSKIDWRNLSRNPLIFTSM
jgi:hypothetical protein